MRTGWRRPAARITVRLVEAADREGVDPFLGEARRAGHGTMPIAIGAARGDDVHPRPTRRRIARQLVARP
jgi:hypothetical protein